MLHDSAVHVLKFHMKNPSLEFVNDELPCGEQRGSPRQRREARISRVQSFAMTLLRFPDLRNRVSFFVLEDSIVVIEGHIGLHVG